MRRQNTGWDAARVASRRPLPKPREICYEATISDNPESAAVLLDKRVGGSDASIWARYACCGFHVCARVPGKCVPQDSEALDPDHFSWAVARLRAGHTLRVAPRGDPSCYRLVSYVNGLVSFRYEDENRHRACGECFESNMQLETFCSYWDNARFELVKAEPVEPVSQTVIQPTPIQIGPPPGKWGAVLDEMRAEMLNVSGLNSVARGSIEARSVALNDHLAAVEKLLNGCLRST